MAAAASVVVLRNRWSALPALAAAAVVAAVLVGWQNDRLGWLVLALVWLAAVLGIRRGRGDLAQALTVALAVVAEVVVIASTFHLLFGWPPRLLQVAAAATLAVPLATVTRVPRRFVAPAITVVGLTALLAGVYLLVVVGLGRPPTQDERTVLALSLAAAGASALLFVPARRRLTAFANRLVGEERQSPEEVVRSFGVRLSRALPLDELLLQVAESLRRVLALDAAEVWTGSGGMLERVVSDPDRGPATLRLVAPEDAVVAGGGVAGPARVAVWLPGLLADRGEAAVRVAPIAQGGELFGLLVAERSDPFDETDERALAELARQLGLALRNVRLDSDLQASLAELRRQAEELRRSRARVVAAADGERRRIERDLHDGAQQHLVALEANLGAVQALIRCDPERAGAIVGELRAAVHEAMQDLRDLAHGIYPPLLQDRGLAEALANAARRATIPTRVEAATDRRYSAAIETTVYFCCIEALQNAAKHAGGGIRATIRLRQADDALVFEVADDGSGLDPARATAGAGLTNMRDRLEAMGGGLRIDSRRGRGTRVTGTIPL